MARTFQSNRRPFSLSQQPVESQSSRRDLPPATDANLEALARWMDSAFYVPGLDMRFGFDALLGLIPGFGDTVTSFISIYIMNAARRYGVPRVTLMRMAANIALDYVVGSVPLLGDVFDVYWKANLKNVALLRNHLLATPAEERRARAGDWLFMVALVFGLFAILAGSLAIAYLVVSRLAHLLVQT